MSFLNTDSFFFRIYYEDSIRDFLHVFDTAKVFLQFIHLFFQSDNFFFRQYIKSTVFLHSLDLFQTFDSALDGLEVCQHTTKPSFVYIVHSASLSFCLNSILSLFLCTNEKNGTAVSYDIFYCFVSCVYHTYCFLQVDDVDTISLCVDVRSHFRVPSSCLMSEMNTCFQ